MIVVSGRSAALESDNTVLHREHLRKMRLDEYLLDAHFSTLRSKPPDRCAGARLVQPPIGEKGLQQIEIPAEGQKIVAPGTRQRRVSLRLLEGKGERTRSGLSMLEQDSGTRPNIGATACAATVAAA